jgi:hypothetical protein
METRKVLVYSFDIMVKGSFGERWFATMHFNIRKNVFSNTYVVDVEEISEFVYSKYPSLKGRNWHIENNPKDTYESSTQKPTVINRGNWY